MSIDIRIDNQDGREALEIAAEVPLWKIPKTLGDNFGKIMTHIKANGAASSGAPYARYLDIDWSAVRTDGPLAQFWKLVTSKQKLCVGIPVAAGVPAADDLQPVTQAPGRCVRAIHRGAYHKVGQTYKQIAEWALKNKVTLANHTTENYINDPGEVATQDLQTLIEIPVVD